MEIEDDKIKQPYLALKTSYQAMNQTHREQEKDAYYEALKMLYRTIHIQIPNEGE